MTRRSVQIPPPAKGPNDNEASPPTPLLLLRPPAGQRKNPPIHSFFLQPALGKVKPDLNGGSSDQILKSILGATATYDRVALDARQRAIFASYHLRNYRGHHIEGSDILIDRCSDVVRPATDAIFVSGECL